jgi:hypothetical protein
MNERDEYYLGCVHGPALAVFCLLLSAGAGGRALERGGINAVCPIA